MAQARATRDLEPRPSSTEAAGPVMEVFSHRPGVLMNRDGRGRWRARWTFRVEQRALCWTLMMLGDLRLELRISLGHYHHSAALAQGPGQVVGGVDRGQRPSNEFACALRTRMDETG